MERNMGKFKRIPVADIQAMKKTLDALPDKNLGKTREQAADMLEANILKALEKGYTAKELAAIMAKGNVTVPAPLIRARALPTRPAPRKREPKHRDATQTAASARTPQAAPAKSATANQQSTPAYYTPDIPDTEL